MSDVSLQIGGKRHRARGAKKLWRNDPLATRFRHLIEFSRSDFEDLNGRIECEQSVPKRRDLVLDGYDFGKLCFVKDGFAARYKLLRNGKRQIVNFVLPGDIVGLPGSFLDRASCSVIAVTDMKLQVCALDAFVELCCERPKFGLVLGWLAAQEAAVYAEHIVNIGRRTPAQRLAHFLLETHARLAMVGRAETTAFDLPFTQEMMSDALGLSVPHLNRMMARLRAEGLIAVNERRVEFRDPRSIALLAQFQPIKSTRIPFPS